MDATTDRGIHQIRAENFVRCGLNEPLTKLPNSEALFLTGIASRIDPQSPDTFEFHPAKPNPGLGHLGI